MSNARSLDELATRHTIMMQRVDGVLLSYYMPSIVIFMNVLTREYRLYVYLNQTLTKHV